MTKSNQYDDKTQAWDLSRKCRDRDVFYSMIIYLSEFRKNLPRDRAIIEACKRALMETHSGVA